MSYDEDIDDDGPSRKLSQRRRRSARMGQKRERMDVREDLIQATLAACAPILPGQIYAVMPGNNGKHTDETIADALMKSNGKRSIAAGYLGMKLRTLEARIADSDMLQDVMYEIDQAGLDVAEIQLDALVMAGADKAVIFKLKTKGKMRGWAENKQPIGGSTLTLDAARELDSKLMSAFAQVRQMAVDAITSQASPAIEQKSSPTTIDVDRAETATIVNSDVQEFDGAGFDDSE